MAAFEVPAYFVEVAQDVGVVIIFPCDGSAIGVHGDELVGVVGIACSTCSTCSTCSYPV